MKGLSKERREKRLLQEVSEDKLITSKKYNMIMSGAIFYGIALNALLCVLLGDAITKISIWAILIPYFVFTIIGVIMTVKSSNPLISFIGYNFVVIPVGVTLSAVISEYGGLASNIVIEAFIYTAIVTAVMIVLSMMFPDFFSRLGAVLLTCLIVFIVIQLCGLLFHFTISIWPWLSAGLFSLYIGYDFYRSQAYLKTVNNAINSALDLYLDIINLFMDILEIVAKNKK